MSNSCFAYSDGKCSALKSKKLCKYPLACLFYKTPDELAAGIQQNYMRLSHLDPVKQMHIATKYYAGKMPWLERAQPLDEDDMESQAMPLF